MGLAPGRLIVEVTENAVIDDIMKARQVFTSLQNAGVRIALDDFGKGYSSLYHLRQLNFDQLKLDGSFVHSMDMADSAKIVSAVMKATGGTLRG
jgi:EAL domain-containing protein (putative c-di-GMP-specific phosphodiesterase class I)